MEIKLNIGDNINIPENCEVVIENNTLTIKEKQSVFKDGDILVVKDNPSFVVIFKEYTSNGRTFCSYFNIQKLSDTNWSVKWFRHATEEEKQAFFDELKAKKLKWNAETKTMEKFRVRVKNGEKYLTINGFGEVIELDEDHCLYDDKKYNLGNYYIPEEREQAEEDAKAIRAIYEKRLEAQQ